jgi:uncharacterized protein (TIGR02687 family)
MSNEKIEAALKSKFQENRIVFWYDDSKEFENELPDLAADEIRIINLASTGSFEAKLHVEVLHPKEKFLLYAPYSRPSHEEDLLLDLYLCSAHFSADSAEIIRDELGLQEIRTREFIKERLSYFTATRKNRLKPLLDVHDDETALGMRMIQVLLGARGSSCSDLLLSLFELAHEQHVDEPKELSEIKKFALDTLLWDRIEDEFGYAAAKDDGAASSSAKRNLGALLRAFVATEVWASIGSNIPPAIKPLAITAPHKASHCAVFLTSWRDSGKYKESYHYHLQRAEDELKLKSHLESLAVSQLVKIQTTESAERLLLTKCRELVAEQSSRKDLDEADLIIANRRHSHWVVNRPHYEAAYQAMNAALGLVRLKEEYPSGFNAFDAKSFIDLYTKELYRFDEGYRLYYQFLAVNDVAGTLTPLTTKVEELYSGWFLPSLASAWSHFVEGSLLQSWEIPGVTLQREFYSKVIKPLLNLTPKPRVAVIISDALRYEVAKELTAQINKRDNTNAEINTMLSVLPSHTALGMAALLPNKSLEYDQSGNVLVDGKSAQGFNNRDQILQAHGGLALSAEDIKTQPRDELRARIGDASLIYIYHNRIDDTGDKASSEKEVFSAVSETLTELDAIIGKVVNSLNCSIAVITADHGFIFTHGDLAATERSELNILSGTPIIEKKRYVVGSNLQTNDRCWRSNTGITAGSANALDVLVPRGINRFHFKGGARYFHGGAMPQEIIVPVVTCRRHRDKAAEATKTSKVDVILLSQISTITSPRQTLKFIQTELTSDKLLPRRVYVGFYDEDFEPVSDVHRLAFDATADTAHRREQSVTFAFKAIKFDQTKDYFLRIVDQDSDAELARQSVRIKILIADEFI